MRPGQPATSPVRSAAPVDPASIGYTVINLREADYLKVKAQLDGVPGMSFPSEVRNLPPTRDFARAVLAQVTPVATEKMAGHRRLEGDHRRHHRRRAGDAGRSSGGRRRSGSR